MAFQVATPPEPKTAMNEQPWSVCPERTALSNRVGTDRGSHCPPLQQSAYSGVVQNFSSRTLPHPSFYSLYVAVGSMQANLEARKHWDPTSFPVSPISPADFYYTDPWKPAGSRVYNTVTQLEVLECCRLNTPPPIMSVCQAAGSNPFRTAPRTLGSPNQNRPQGASENRRVEIIQLSREEDQAVSTLLELRLSHLERRGEGSSLESVPGGIGDGSPLRAESGDWEQPGNFCTVSVPEPTAASSAPAGEPGLQPAAKRRPKPEMDVAQALLELVKGEPEDSPRRQTVVSLAAGFRVPLTEDREALGRLCVQGGDRIKPQEGDWPRSLEPKLGEPDRMDLGGPDRLAPGSLEAPPCSQLGEGWHQDCGSVLAGLGEEGHRSYLNRSTASGDDVVETSLDRDESETGSAGQSCSRDERLAVDALLDLHVIGSRV
ncbi:uncharacterized protein LOC131721963 isoform X1 [Acipenser ruthenus]|uniref:uncharacterized protein LOC131721963 isoform X1 n=1 Tax=Acipenser ruthenus TaxID=7906 RepID=UPI00274263E5|nr:uncharacterized protein LOC131721963 isoform X1 [Acipenser ruthenus]XP_058871369.1 uncharacterized protein LOC131721963 isoform X1 [Acipenser ruthenus]